MSSHFIDRFDAIGLEELDTLSLMNRIDTKFVFHVNRLEEFLSYLQPYYKVLEIKGTRIMPYHSIYLDTPGMYLYHCHHNGRRARYKVRFRDYLISDISFLEIKKKTNQERTKKKRISVPYKVSDLTTDSNAFLKNFADLDGETMIKVLENNFSRITLAGFETRERVTLDMNVSWTKDGKTFDMPDVVIAEVKRCAGCACSPVMMAVKKMQIRPASFSKYCFGVVNLYDNVKKNNFKPKILKIKKILQ